MEDTKLERISLDAVRTLIVEHGCQVEASGEGTLRVHDLDSGITMHVVLEDNILFCSVPCMTVLRDSVTPVVMNKMLDAANEISTSGFQLYDRGDGQVTVTLNNFCKLQEMGPDDQDDILSCLEFLAVDVVAARDLLAELT